MKPDFRFPLFGAPRSLLLAALVSVAAAVSSASGQTGFYTLTGGANSESGKTYGATMAGQSGVYVLDSGELTLLNPVVTKTGNSAETATSSDFGINAGVLARLRGQVAISGGSITTNATAAAGLFATGVGAAAVMSEGTITTTGSFSIGAGVSFGATAGLTNVKIKTQESDSPAVSTDFGGGTVTVVGGSFVTAGSVSPALFSAGTISVESATLTAHTSPGAIIDGDNAIYLVNCSVLGLLAVVQMEQDTAAAGSATLTIDGGVMTSLAGDLVSMASASGTLTAAITLENGATVSAASGNLVNATSHSVANFVASGETLAGNFVTDGTSSITAALANGTALTGQANAGNTGTENLAIDATSTWNVNGGSNLANLKNLGTLAFTSDGLTVAVAGAYKQGAAGKLVVVLDGTKAGTNYDQLAVTGQAALAGTLEVNTASGFTPTIGEIFNVVTYGNVAGSFSKLMSSSGLTYTVSYGATAATITITGTSGVSSAPIITAQPQSARVASGASVTFAVTASGSGPLSYQWYNDGQAIPGATKAFYTIPQVDDTDAGSYDVVVTNSIGHVTSAAAVLKIKATTVVPAVVTIAVDGNGEIVTGGTKGKAVITRTGDTTDALTVYYTLGGNAVNGLDYVGPDGGALPGSIVIPAGAASVNLKIVATSDVTKSEIEKVNVILAAGSTGSYTLGSTVKAKFELINE